LRRILRERLARPTPPPGLQSRIERAVGLAHARTRPSWRALAASLLLAVALGSGSTWFVLRQGAHDRTTEAAVDAHVRGRMAARPTASSAKSACEVGPAARRENSTLLCRL
jgi:hypothetical protein